MVTARAWCRVDLAGGTLDIWPIGLLHRDASTISCAIDLPVTVALASASGFRIEQGDEVVEARDLDELLRSPSTALLAMILEHVGLQNVHVRVSSASPRGGGLGASSAIAVAALRAAEAFLGRREASVDAIAATARDLEARLMGLPTGTQDHYAAHLGGLVELAFRPGGVVANRLDGVDLAALGDHLLVAYSGQSHFSAGQNWQVVRRRLDGEPRTVALFDGIAATATELKQALLANDFAAVGRLVAQEWSLRRQLADGVSTTTLERLLSEAAALGAWGGKACGAGGGGCAVLLCPKEKGLGIVNRLTALGFEVLPAKPVERSLDVVRD